MRSQKLFLPLFCAALFPLAAHAQQPPQPQQPANEQVIQPQVERRQIKLPKIPSNDIEVGAFAGTYATENFGSSLVYGLRLGYHITEDFFVEGAYAQTKVSDENFRQILPGGVFARPKETLTYYNLSAGYNILPGEVFVGRNTAWASALYLVLGIGSTEFIEQRRQTINYGLGLRVFLADWFALQVDMRDHVFSLDLLGKRQDTHNLEFTTGFTFFF
ncbi:MAG TPA: outer membrane beta-barrel domain-containing protein [Burkholderiaceae bacterium]|nr:outer membrane beta-barrel domain-containing protein [Burkholderiaceae bacterium]